MITEITITKGETVWVEANKRNPDEKIVMSSPCYSPPKQEEEDEG